MKGNVKEYWEQLCEQAAVEQDTEKLIQLVTEINQTLDEKENRVREQNHARRNAPNASFGTWRN